MLKSLEFENFKSWGGRHRLDFGRITGLFGANSSGKSSIIHLLLLLKQTVEFSESTIVLNFQGNASDDLDFGSFLDVVTDHDISMPISFSIDWTSESTPRSEEFLAEDINLSSTLRAIRRRMGEEVVVDQLSYARHVRITVDSPHSVFTDYVESLDDPISVTSTRRSSGAYALEASFKDKASFRSKRASRMYTPVGLHRFNPQTEAQIDRWMAERSPAKTDKLQAQDRYDSYRPTRRAENYMTNFLSGISYLGPLREHPQRDYRWTGTKHKKVGHRGEHAIQALLAGAWQRSSGSQHRNRLDSDRSSTVVIVSNWLRKLGIAESLSFQPVGRGARIWEARLHQKDGDADVNLADAGFGVSQVLPVIVTLLSAPAGSLVILEHPEIHLHPRLQGELADLLVEVADTSEVQILVESHSEHLLARIQRRISESSRGDGSLSPEDVRLYFCEQQKGRSKLTPLEMQSSGVITNWPDDFFGDMLAERMALSGFYPKSDNRKTEG